MPRFRTASSPRPTPPGARCRRRAGRASLAVAVLLVAVLLAGVACRPAAPAFGSSAAEARANADAFFGAMAAHFTNVQRSPKFAAARGKLSRHALSPSRIFDDTSVWNGGGGSVRSLTLAARFLGNRYVFDDAPAAGAPVAPGDGWHYMRLRRLGEDQYEWVTLVDMAVGEVTPDELREVWRALLATAVRTPGAPLRLEYRAAVPRATRVVGQLATLDTLDVRPVGDGTAVIALSVSLHPERLRARYPHFAQYLVKYVQPARFAFTFADRGGARWLLASGRQNRLTFRLRATADGRLAPLDGPARPLPDTLVMRGEAYAKFSIFTVGMSDLVADVAIVDGARERGWDFRFRREPDWHFPLAVNHLISAALRRPFAGEGAQLRLTARHRTDGRTVIARRVLVNVQEGAIVRWLGGLGAGAMDEFSGRAEEDENRFAVELFGALQDDFAALLASAATAPREPVPAGPP